MTIFCLYQDYERIQLLLNYKGKLSIKNIDLERERLTSTLSSQLVLEIQNLCSTAGTDLENITHISCTNGPSSFTGLRITLATLQGLALTNKAKTYVCSTLKLEAFATGKKQVYVPNGKGEYFEQLFGFSNSIPVPEEEPRIVSLEKELTLKATAQDLLKIAELEDNWGSYQLLQPFYGHTPEYKKKRNFI